MNPFPGKVSEIENKAAGIPEALQTLFYQKESFAKATKADFSQCEWLQLSSVEAVELLVARRQHEMRSLYSKELIPLMNANPLDPTVHSEDLSPEFVRDLQQYVRLQNSPRLFFDLMQWLERDVAIRRWHIARLGENYSSAEVLRFVMDSWVDADGTRRKHSIICPTGVPLGYMQSVRKKNQPFITQEFAEHAHGAFNHWLQEHIWQRFCARYPAKCQLSPAEFFKQIGRSHFAFADAIYELHMANVANPANTNFWSVLQFYLPFMSPWP
ncbi:MAG: hypothetical protein AAFY72_03420 [Cyanobacteria bacterium J06649_4]